MPPAAGNLTGGGVSERPKERASKAREVQASEGSNPSATAQSDKPKRWARHQVGASRAAVWVSAPRGSGGRRLLN
jgi:hypothetical protein